MERPGWTEPLRVRRVPPPTSRPEFLGHPRLRRSSPISHFVVGAALEALGTRTAAVREGSLRLGIVISVLTGCVNYSRRFFDEVLKDPPGASPLVFPETVFNAPSSHLAALLQTREINYTLVGDPGTFLEGLALAAEWLETGQIDGCLVIGAEEGEWLAVDAYRLTAPEIVLGEGAGALYLSLEAPGGLGAELTQVTNPHLFYCRRSRAEAALRVQAELCAHEPADLLCDGLQGVVALDAPEEMAWAGWPGARLSPKRVLGEGLMAAGAWQSVIAAEALRRGLRQRANVSVTGCNQQAIGAQFRRTDEGKT